MSIPASQEWLGLINAALLMLTEAWRYEQVNETDLTPEATAAAAYALYVAYLESECGMACCPLRRNPVTGLYEQSEDGGLTWTQVDDGPWVDPLVDGSIYWPPVKERTGSDYAVRCEASFAAANVLQSFYQQTVGWLLQWTVGGAIRVAQLIAQGAEILSGVAVGANLIGTAQALYEDTALFTDGGFPDEDLEQLQNILFCRSTATDGVVTFDFAGVEADIGALSGTPWDGLSLLLAIYLTEDGLNAAGNIDFDGGDCSGAECVDCAPGALNAIEYLYDSGSWSQPGVDALASCGGGILQGTWYTANGPVTLDLGEDRCVYRIQINRRYVPATGSQRVTNMDVAIGPTEVATAIGGFGGGSQCIDFLVFENLTTPVQGSTITLTPNNGAVYRFRSITVWYYTPE